MARCGCATTQNVSMQGDGLIQVSGEGTSTSPFVVSLVYQTQHGCDAVMLCVSEHVGVGLFIDATQLAVKVSADADNTNINGSHTDGLYGIGFIRGPADCSSRTIASLRQSGNVLSVGALRQAFLTMPSNMVFSTEYCLAQGVDIIHAHTLASVDGISCMVDDWEGRVDRIRTTIPITRWIRDIPAEVFLRSQNNAGHDTDPEMNQGLSLTDVDVPNAAGGWWGWRTQRAYNYTFAELLAMVARQAVVIADCTSQLGDAHAISSVQAAARTIDAGCARPWALVGVETLTAADAAIALGQTPIMISNNTSVPTKATNGTLPWTVASLTSRGITWVCVDKLYTDSVFQAYSAAGINVIAMHIDRHIDRQRIEALRAGTRPGIPALANVCGYLSQDPVYTRGPAVSDYRSTTDPYRLKTIAPGVLSAFTDIGSFKDSTGKRARGYCTVADPGVHLAEAFNTERETGLSIGRSRATLLQGWACPLPNPSSYTVTFEMKFRGYLPQANNSPKIGIMFGQADDRDVFGWPDTDTQRTANVPQAYFAYLRANGSGDVGVLLWRNGNVVYVNGTQERISQPPLDVASGAPAADVWYRCQLTVTPTNFTWTARIGTPQQTTVTVVNNEYRGPYLYLFQEFLDVRTAPGMTQGSFRNISVN